MKNSGFTRLLRSLAKYRLLIIGMLLSSAVGNTMLLLAPRHIAKAIDLIAPLNGDYSLLLQELVILGALYVSGGIFTWLSMVLANSAANRTVRDLRNQLFEKLARLPLGYFDNNPRGDMISRFTNDINAISDGLNQGVIQLVSGIITVVLSLVFMLTLNPYVTLVAVFVMPISFLIGFSITKYGKSKFKEQSRVLGQLNGYAEETISSHHTVKAFGYEKAADTRFGEINRQLYECGYRAQFASALVNPSTRFVNNIAYVLVGVLGIIAVLRNTLTVGGVAGFLTYTAQFSKPFNEITAVTMQLQLAMASARRVFGLLDEEELRQSTVSENLPGGLGLVEFKDVCFSYQPETPLIKNLNLSVRPGETIAIVGPTGAGKTTLVNLLMRFYEIDSGSILIGGEDITSLTRESLRRSFGMVLQDTWLFSGTVRDNIAYPMVITLPSPRMAEIFRRDKNSS